MSEIGFGLIDTPSHPQQFWIALGLLGVPLLWLISCSSIALLARTQKLAHRATTARILVKTYTVAMLLLALVTIGFKTSGHQWFQRDKLNRIDPAKSAGSAFEYDVALRVRQKLREILGDQP